VSHGNGRQLDERLDAYVDGALDPRERAEFERRLGGDAALRAEIQRQRAIDEALFRLFPLPSADRAGSILHAARQRGEIAVPELPEADESTSAAPQGIRPRRPFFRRISTYAYAATILLLAGGGWWVKTVLFPPYEIGSDQPLPFVKIEPAAAIQRIERENYEPDVVCKDDQQFAALTWKYTKQGLLLPQPLPAGVEVVGWSLAQTILSRQTLVLMTKVDGQWVYVIIDTKHNDRPLTSPPGYRLFRGEVGNLFLYEVTPLDEPKLLKLFFDPKKDEAWYRAGMIW
jgi:hypothetical protein